MAYLSPFSVNKISPVKVSAFKRVDKCLCGCNIGCNGNIMNVAKAEKGVVIRIRVLIHRITEEKKKIYLIAGNAGSNLFTAPVAAA